MKRSADKHFIKRLKTREPRAFEQLIAEHQQMVYSLLYRMLGSAADAEDVLQEVFITVFKKIESFRGESSLSTWVYRIAINHCINRQKYLKRRDHYRGKSLADLTDQEQRTGSGRLGELVPRPDEMAEGRQMEMLIQRAISELEPDFRMILVLRDIQNLSYDEIVDILGVPEGTVKSRLHRARMELKDQLSPHLPDKG